MKIKITQRLCLILLICLSLNLYSQITISHIEKKTIDTAILKPEPYDSTKDFSHQDNAINYNQYIGLKVYLPPCKNLNKEYQWCGDVGFLFSTKPTILQIDSNLKLYKNGLSMEYKSGKGWIPAEKYQRIITYIYKPLHYCSNNCSGGGCPAVGIVSNCLEVGDKYYTIIDVYFKTKRDSIIKQIYNTLYKLGKKDEDAFYLNGIWNLNSISERIRVQNDIIFLLKNDVSGDSLYCFNIDKFVLVPYFVKRKQIYQGKNIYFKEHNNNLEDITTGEKITVEKESKWLCLEVTLLDQKIIHYCSDEYSPFYILKNEQNEIAFPFCWFEDFNNPPFITEEKYLAEQEYNKMLEERNLERQKELAAELKKEEDLKSEREKNAKEKYLQKCIDKFGKENGLLIFQGKVKIGMSQEMCEIAWGKSWDIYKTTDASGVYEKWFYGWKRILYFMNGILYRIEE